MQERKPATTLEGMNPITTVMRNLFSSRKQMPT